jgi:hypothetical protein
MSFAQPQTINPDLSIVQNAQLPQLDQTVDTGGAVNAGVEQNSFQPTYIGQPIDAQKYPEFDGRMGVRR